MQEQMYTYLKTSDRIFKFLKHTQKEEGKKERGEGKGGERRRRCGSKCYINTKTYKTTVFLHS